MDERPGGGGGGRRRLLREPTAADVSAARAEEDAAAVASDSDSDGEFEFPFVSREEGSGGAVAADELFAGGRIRAFYPVFGRVLDEDAAGPAAARPPRAPLGRLFQLEEARASSVASTSSSSSSASTAADAGLDGAAPDSYCLWTPGSSPASSPSRPPPRPRKSGSTGSIARWRRIGDLVVGRSHSDGRDKFLFLSAPPSPTRDSKPNKHPPATTRKPNKVAGAGPGATELDTVAAGRRLSYGGASPAAKGSPGARRTFLPYRQDLMGLFANMNGLSRSHHHPF